jgi:hypothetical protein
MKNDDETTPAFEEGSGNVFADLGLRLLGLAQDPIQCSAIVHATVGNDDANLGRRRKTLHRLAADCPT